MQHLFISSKIPLLVVVSMIGPFLANGSSQLRESFLDHLRLDDDLFTQDVIMKVSARSRIECSKKCVETKGCVMCTFHSSPEGPPGLCRLHSQLQKGTDVKEDSPGARSVGLRQPPRTCDGAGYQEACNSCLKIVSRPDSYASASHWCSQEHGHLVRTKTSAKSDCIWNFRKTKGLNRIWAGADDMVTPNAFQWNDGAPLPGYSNLWKSGQPDLTSTHDCAYFNPSGKGLWDATCTEKYSYICEKQGW